jgi:transcriptional regulator with XRE-family HTH domain
MSIMKKKNTNNKKAFGASLKKIRESKGMSQLDLASLSSLEKTSISRIENGRTNITLTTAIILSSSLGIKLKELFDFEVEIES